MPYTKRELAGIVIVVALFAVAQFAARQYGEQIQSIVGAERVPVGMLAYAMIGITATVIAPISSLPLVPIAAAVWGSFATAVVTLIAWTIGSIIAFALARTYGRKIIGRVVDMGSMQKLERMMGSRNAFISAILLRMVVPVDILSYALGLFSTIGFGQYCVATVIGMIPFVLFFSYAIVIPIQWQVVMAVGIFAVVLLILSKGLQRR